MAQPRSVSSYYIVRKEKGFLEIPERKWLDIARRVAGDAHFVKELLTLQQEGRNMLIQF